jgi:hypothetical protein
MSVVLVAGCATSPPKQQDNLCAIFDQHPEWYDAAKESQNRWGTPPHILMAFVKQESAFRHDARPPRDWFLFIPLWRKSSAKGQGQAGARSDRQSRRPAAAGVRGAVAPVRGPVQVPPLVSVWPFCK